MKIAIKSGSVQFCKATGHAALLVFMMTLSVHCFSMPTPCSYPLYNNQNQFDPYVIETLNQGINISSYHSFTPEQYPSVIGAIRFLLDTPVTGNSWLMTDDNTYNQYARGRIHSLAKMVYRTRTILVPDYQNILGSTCNQSLLYNALTDTMSKPDFVQRATTSSSLSYGKMASSILAMAVKFFDENYITTTPESYEGFVGLAEQWFSYYGSLNTFYYHDYWTLFHLFRLYDEALAQHESINRDSALHSRITANTIPQQLVHIASHLDNCGTCYTQMYWILYAAIDVMGQYAILGDQQKGFARDVFSALFSASDGIYQKLAAYSAELCEHNLGSLVRLNNHFKTAFLDVTYSNDEQQDACRIFGGLPCLLDSDELAQYVSTAHCEQHFITTTNELPDTRLSAKSRETGDDKYRRSTNIGKAHRSVWKKAWESERDGTSQFKGQLYPLPLKMRIDNKRTNPESLYSVSEPGKKEQPASPHLQE